MDSLFCGKATGRRTCHRHIRLDGPFESIFKIENEQPPAEVTHFLVEEDGFEPSKAKPADLQSVPFGHLGTPPYSVGRKKVELVDGFEPPTC